MLEIGQGTDNRNGGGLGGGMITLILGGVVLWVGKQHSNTLDNWPASNREFAA